MSARNRRFMASWCLGTTIICVLVGLVLQAARQAGAAHQLMAFASLANLVNLRTAMTPTRPGCAA